MFYDPNPTPSCILGGVHLTRHAAPCGPYDAGTGKSTSSLRLATATAVLNKKQFGVLLALHMVHNLIIATKQARHLN